MRSARLSPVVLLLLVNLCYGEALYAPKEEVVTLSDPPCDCALATKQSSACQPYKNWLIIENGYASKLSTRSSRYEIEEVSPFCKVMGSCWLLLRVSRDVVVLSTENFSSIGSLLSHKREVVFCQGSISRNVSAITLIKVEKVVFVPKAVEERTNPLLIELNAVKRDIFFPSSLYYYMEGSAVPDSSNDLTYETAKNPSMNISLIEVANVHFYSMALRVGLLNLSIIKALKVTIEPSAVLVDTFSSKTYLANIVSLELECYWSFIFTAESCGEINLHSFNFSHQIENFSLYRIGSLTSLGASSVLSNKVNYGLIRDIDQWNYIFGSPVFNQSRNSTPSDFRGNNQQDSPRTLILDSVFLRIISRNSEDSTAAEIRMDRFDLRDSNFTRENDSSSEISLIGKRFRVNDSDLPSWVHLCQLRFDFGCRVSASSANFCSVGRPYSAAGDEDIDCLTLEAQDTTLVVVVFAIVGAALLFVLSLFAIYYICLNNKLSGRWRPERLPRTYLESSTQGTESRYYQILCVPSNHADIISKLTNDFSSTVSPLRTLGTGTTIYSLGDLRAASKEGRRKGAETDVRKLDNVQLTSLSWKEDEQNQGPTVETDPSEEEDSVDKGSRC